MAFAVIIVEVRLGDVMIETAYGRHETTDYPDLAGKANQASAGSARDQHIARAAENG